MTSTVFLVLTAASVLLVSGQELCITEDQGYEFLVLSVLENTPIGTEIAVVPIVGDETEVILKARNHSNLQFNSTSRTVVLVDELDSDRDVPELAPLVIECTEQNATDPRMITISVRVLIKDWNDNPPVFDKSHQTVSVQEDTLVGTVIHSDLIATDNDKPFSNNAALTYTIVQGHNYSSYFQILAPTRPTITLAKSLDFESVRVMTVQIRAADNPDDGFAPSLSATATLTVSVLDADDQNPVFTKKSYTGSISEDAKPGDRVDVKHKIVAYDPDTMNVTVQYRLLDPYDMFAINATTAEVYTLKNLYVDVPTVTVVVMAYQTDNPSREWFAMLTISVTKANVNAPRFSQTEYHVTKVEMEPVGSTLITTTATDPDFGTIIFYAIKETIRDIVINDFGSLILIEPLDYEKEQQRVVHVTASDGIYTATTTVVIDILDVNDNNPVIQTQGSKFISERENGLLVTKVEATDADINSTLTFQLENYQNLFTINEEGEIIISGHPETLVSDRYPLLITVRDNGIPPRAATTLIDVLFPSDGVTRSPSTERAAPSIQEEEPNMLMMIIMGAVAGVLLVIIMILVVYIVWRNKRVKQELDKARAPRGAGPQGLTYRSAEAPDDLPRMDLHYREDVDDVDAISDFDGATTVQQNPLNDAAVNKGYHQSSSSEMDRDVSEIEIETAVIPYDDDYGYSSSSSKYTNGPLRTFHADDSTSSGSGQSDSTHGSRRVLVNENKKDGTGKMTTWDSDDQLHPQGSEKLLDPNTAVTPVKTKKEKPEITVYF